MKQLSSSLEDYLECIYNHIRKNGNVKAVEISKGLEVSRASVTEALNKLSKSGFINYGRYENISMTNVGIQKAEEIIEKHSVLLTLFRDILGIESLEATEIACKMEHIVSKNSLLKIKKFNEDVKKERIIV